MSSLRSADARPSDMPVIDDYRPSSLPNTGREDLGHGHRPVLTLSAPQPKRGQPRRRCDQIIEQPPRGGLSEHDGLHPRIPAVHRTSLQQREHGLVRGWIIEPGAQVHHPVGRWRLALAEMQISERDHGQRLHGAIPTHWSRR